jgi:hypothetical protein
MLKPGPSEGSMMTLHEVVAAELLAEVLAIIQGDLKQGRPVKAQARLRRTRAILERALGRAERRGRAEGWVVPVGDSK